MSFLFPLFLLAASAIAIPLMIHLFNLRRYKTVYFSNTRFLKNIQLHSQKQSQLRYKWLLLLRILFLLALVVAFAQPVFRNSNQSTSSDLLQIIYLDNSNSMSVKKGVRTIFEIAKERALQQIEKSAPDSRFLLLSNDKPATYSPVTKEKAAAMVRAMELSSASKSADQTFATVGGLMQDERRDAILYYYSDFQQNRFPAVPTPEWLSHIRFVGIPIRSEQPSNVYIDTAFLTTPLLQTGQNIQLVVKSHLIGKPPKEQPIIQLFLNNQMKSAVSVDFSQGSESKDTLSFQINTPGWQHLTLTVNDAAIPFDDTFRIAVKTASNLSVLTLNAGAVNPYILAAFRSYSGFRNEQKEISTNLNWKNYNLIVLNGITRFQPGLAEKIKEALENGQHIALFPGRTTDIEGINEGLRQVGEFRIVGLDTARQAAAMLQEGSDLVRDLFERIPDNVQLPVANWHYIVDAGMTANQQSVLSFRNGDPLLAQYTPSRGKFFLLTTGADLASGNFAASYFFVPFLYQMAAQARAGNIFAFEAGSSQVVYLPLTHSDERNMVRLYGKGTDVIPPQRTAGAGVQVFLSDIVHQPGFYNLYTAGSDTTLIAVNNNRSESDLVYWDLSQLQQRWKGKNIEWQQSTSAAASSSESSSFPWWKVMVALALLALFAESMLLIGKRRKPIEVAR